MKAFVTEPNSVLGASLIGALRWEGHVLAQSLWDADSVFDTRNGVIYRRDRPLSRFIFGEILGPGDVRGSEMGEWLIHFARRNAFAPKAGGTCITDARDVAIAMLASAERGRSGEFDVIGPFVTFEEAADILSGAAQSRTSVAIPELSLSFRPVEETLHDVVEWQRSRLESMVA